MKRIFLLMTLMMTMVACSSKSVADPEGVDTFKTKSGKKVVFTCIKHGSIRITFDGKEIEIDPVTKMPIETDYKTFPKADYIFVTHEHGDHFDKQAIEDLWQSTTKLVTNQRCAEQLGYGTVMANGDKLELAKNIKVEAVPAYNNSEGKEKFHPKGRDNGFILTLDDFRVYIAGDTEDIPEMENIKDIDVAFLPCNQPYTMLPEQLAHAVRMIQPKVVFPYHYSSTKVEECLEFLKDVKVDFRIRNYQ